MEGEWRESGGRARERVKKKGEGECARVCKGE